MSLKEERTLFLTKGQPKRVNVTSLYHTSHCCQYLVQSWFVDASLSRAGDHIKGFPSVGKSLWFFSRENCLMGKAIRSSHWQSPCDVCLSVWIHDNDQSKRRNQTGFTASSTDKLWLLWPFQVTCVMSLGWQSKLFMKSLKHKTFDSTFRSYASYIKLFYTWWGFHSCENVVVRHQILWENSSFPSPRTPNLVLDDCLYDYQRVLVEELGLSPVGIIPPWFSMLMSLGEWTIGPRWQQFRGVDSPQRHDQLLLHHHQVLCW
jgi:hypothetical protein